MLDVAPDTVKEQPSKKSSREHIPVSVQIERALSSEGRVYVEVHFTYRGEPYHLRDLIIRADGRTHIFAVRPDSSNEPLFRREEHIPARMTYYASWGWEVCKP